MYFITLNERERKQEIAQKRQLLAMLMNGRAEALSLRAKYPKHKMHWDKSIERWNEMIYNCARDVRKLIARDNRTVPQWRTA